VENISKHKLAYVKHLGNIVTNNEAWSTFKNSWNNLSLDSYMADGGKYRERRYSVFLWNDRKQKIEEKPYEPHYQTLHYNNLNGGVERHYDMFEPNTLINECFQNIMRFALNVINQLSPNSDWHIEAHQFRIRPQNTVAKPTPEGVHRDGRDYIIMMLIDKINIDGGISSIYDNNGTLIKEVCLDSSLETIMVCDNSTMHGVSAIEKIDSMMEGYRDMLVITFINQDKIK
jgi:hypothetical protein